MKRIALLVALVLGACEAEMYRIDTPNAAAVKPTPSAVGTQGYFQDTDPGGSTDLSADFFNAMMEELATVIEAAGLTLDKADDGQLEEALRQWDEIGAVISDASDTGTVTTQHLRAVLASGTSRASGARSVCAASIDSVASGAASAALASNDCAVSGNVSAALASFEMVVSGVVSAAIASEDGTVSGDRSVLIASDAQGYDLADDYTLAGAGPAGLTWALHSDTGDAEFTGDVDVTGEAAAGTLKVGGGYGSTGLSVAADGDLQTNGDVTVGAGGGAGGVSINAAAGEVIADLITVTTGNAYQIGAATGASGSFTTADGKTVTVTGGIITQIV